MKSATQAIRRRDFLRATAAAGVIAGSWPTGARGDAPGPVKVAQIGTAHDHASGKLHTLRKLKDDFDLVGVCEPDPERRAAAEKNSAYQGVRWLSEEQLLGTPGLRVVAVETRVEDLLSTATRCVDAGLHVHLDKPAGESLSAFRKLLDAATARGVVVQMGYMYRHNPAFRFCFQAVRDDWLGEVFEVYGLMSKEITPEERRRNLPFRGGMMFQLGCHLIDAMVRVLGKADRVTPHERRVRRDLDNLVDNPLAVFDYPTATATIRVSVTEPAGFQRRQFVVAGTEGTIEIRPLEPPSLVLTLNRPRGDFVKGRQEVKLPAMPGRYDDQLRHLARVARGQEKPEYAPAHDLVVQELVLRASGMAVDG